MDKIKNSFKILTDDKDTNILNSFLDSHLEGGKSKFFLCDETRKNHVIVTYCAWGLINIPECKINIISNSEERSQEIFQLICARLLLLHDHSFDLTRNVIKRVIEVDKDEGVRTVKCAVKKMEVTGDALNVFIDTEEVNLPPSPMVFIKVLNS
jgi:hypothetical protein